MATKNLVAYKDTAITGGSSGAPDSAYYGTFNYIYCGTNNTGSIYFRALMGFDLSQIPAGSTINSATLYLRHVDDPDIYTRTLTFDLYRVTGTWTQEACTWNTQPAVEAIPTYSGLTMAAYHDGDKWESYSITALFQEMFVNGNDSIELRDHNEGTDTYSQRRFIAREWSTSWCTYIAVDYTPPMKIAVSEGSVDKNVVKMMVAPSAGAINKNVIGLKVYDGANWKTVF